MTHREQLTYLSTHRKCYVRYFRVSELTVVDEQIRHKHPRDLHVSTAAARTLLFTFWSLQRCCTHTYACLCELSPQSLFMEGFYSEVIRACGIKDQQM